MINWIIGGLIIGATALIIARKVISLRKGENACGCSGCSGASCCSSKDKCGC